MTLMIHHLHALGSAKCQPLLTPPRATILRYRKTWRENSATKACSPPRKTRVTRLSSHLFN